MSPTTGQVLHQLIYNTALYQSDQSPVQFQLHFSMKIENICAQHESALPIYFIKPCAFYKWHEMSNSVQSAVPPGVDFSFTKNKNNLFACVTWCSGFSDEILVKILDCSINSAYIQDEFHQKYFGINTQLGHQSYTKHISI